MTIIKTAALMLTVLISQTLLIAQTDTTRSETRVVPVNKSTPVQTEDKKKKQCDDNDEDSDSSGSFFENLFFHTVLGALRLTIVEPMKGFVLSNPSLDTFNLGPIYGGVGISFIDFTNYSQISSNNGINYSFDIFLKRTGSLLVRQHIAAHLSPICGVEGKFARDVLVNSSYIGTEYDEIYSYVNDSYHFCTEVIYFPGVSTFYIGAGAGPRYVKERSELIRTSTFSSQTLTFNDHDNDWIPSFSLCLGKIFNSGTTIAALEFRCHIGVNQNRKRHSLPSDNTSFVTGFTLLQYQLFFSGSKLGGQE